MKSKNSIIAYALFRTLSIVCISGTMAFNLTKQNLISTMKKVANRQLQLTYSTTNSLHDYDIGSWTNATLYLGMLRWTGITDNSIR